MKELASMYEKSTLKIKAPFESNFNLKLQFKMGRIGITLESIERHNIEWTLKDAFNICVKREK